jgi:hypothetical protein
MCILFLAQIKRLVSNPKQVTSSLTARGVYHMGKMLIPLTLRIKYIFVGKIHKVLALKRRSCVFKK